MSEDKIIKTEYSDEMSAAYIDYAMSVITARAVPDVRDGLKPVQRRILYDMHQLHVDHDKPYRKCARIVGDTMGKYHPHGDSSIYDALVVMSQEFKKELPLVDGHGNFGSIEGDGAAAMRYTEARLQKVTQDELLSDLELDVVAFAPNFDDTEKEPVVLPAKIPNFLINGSEGIAVGMTTNTPPHNLAETIDAECYLIKHPEATTDELCNIIIGPDWPTGGCVVNKKDLNDIYRTGTGKIKLRGKIEFVPGEKKTDRDKLIISEIPATMVGSGLAKFFSDLEQLIRSKEVTDVVDVINASGKDGIHIVLELKKNADVENIKNILYRRTKLEDTFSVNMLAITDGKPEVLSLKSILENHISFLIDINQKKYQRLLEKASERKEILEGLIKAYDMIDLIMKILKASGTVKEARRFLVSGMGPDRDEFLPFTEIQAEAILNMRLQRLVGLEITQLKKELAMQEKNIKRYNLLLNNKKKLLQQITEDLQKTKAQYGRERKTEIKDEDEIRIIKTKEAEEDYVFVMNRFGYCKMLELSVYEKNMETVHKEYKVIFPCKNTEMICVFSNKGKLYKIKAGNIPVERMKEKGIPIDNFVKWKEETYVEVVKEEQLREKEIIFITSFGYIKRTLYEDLKSNMRAVIATKLTEGDNLLKVIWSNSKIIELKSREGVNSFIDTTSVKPLKKNAIGSRMVRLDKGDIIVEVAEKTN